MRIILERFCYSENGTFGSLILPDGSELATVERPWLNNKKSASCIPIGNYDCGPRLYNRGGYEAVEVLDVPNRSYILFHKGNFVRYSKGCILVNSYHGAVGDEWCGKSSAVAFKAFMDEVGGQSFRLIIKNKANGIIT